MDRSRALLLAASLALPAVITTAPRAAQAQSAEDKNTARALGVEGQDALDKKDFKTAEDKFSRADALFHTGVTRAEWDEASARWRITTDRGDEITSRYYVLAVGLLNLLKLPALSGMEDFAGPSFHTARWDYEVTGGAPGDPHLTKLGDKVVGLIGTGATGIQCLPPLAESAKHVIVFQRTPSAGRPCISRT